jgi:hypothetical protein
VTAHPPRPEPDGFGRPGRPAPVDNAVRLIWLLIALNVVVAVVTFLNLDSVVDQALTDADVSDPEAATAARSAARGSVVIGLLIGVGLNTVLAVHILRGANWARITYTVVGGLGVLLTTLSYLTGSAFEQPSRLVLLGMLGFVLTVVVLVQLWRRESSAWFVADRTPGA